MALGGINQRAIQALAQGSTLWDAGHREAVKGFGVRRQRGNPVYVVKYRTLGRQRFVTIGRHGSPWTPDKARREAKRLLGLVADGKDPQLNKADARTKAADTLKKVADEYLKYAEKKQKPRTYAETNRHLLKNWKPLHSMSIFDIRRRHVADRLEKIEADHGPSTAGGARAALSAMFNWAVRKGYEIEANPVTGTNRPLGPKSRKRVLTDSELAEVWHACGEDDYGRIVRLLMLTAQRRDEVGGMLRTEIARELWTIPGERTKNHEEHWVPLPAQARAIVNSAARLTNRDHLFGAGPRREGDRQRGFSGWSKAKAELDDRILEARRKSVPKAEAMAWRLHDLRRTASTVMQDRLGVLPHIAEAVLNHISGHKAGVAGVYNQAKYLEPMRKALAVWARHIESVTAA